MTGDQEDAVKRIAIVVSSVGYHWEELFDAYFVFKDASFAIELFTPAGEEARPDPKSIRKRTVGSTLGLGVRDSYAPASARGTELRRALLNVRPVDEMNVEALDALYLPGGHGCLFDVNSNATLHGKIQGLYARGALLSAVCHATSTFAFVRVNGRSIVGGHEITGFPHPLDRMLLKLGAVDDRFLPLPLVNDRELRRAGARLPPSRVAWATLNPRYVKVSWPFVTGVGPKAAAGVARAIVTELCLTASAEPAKARRAGAPGHDGPHSGIRPAGSTNLRIAGRHDRT